MTFFWIATAAIIAISSVLIAFPLIQKRAVNDDARRDELNKAFYRDRLNELEEEAKEGLVENQQDLIADLKQTLLDDVPKAKKDEATTKISTAMVAIPSVLFVAALSYGMYFQFGGSQKVVDWHQAEGNLPVLTKKLMSPQGQALTDDEMKDLTLALRTRLHHQPEDSTGWMLLGRIALANRDVTTAIGSMKKAYRLEQKDTDIQLGYAQALMLSSDEVDQNQARSLLHRLVQQDMVDLRVFSLLAFDAFERADYAAAIRYWGAMQKMIGPSDNRYEMLERSIQSAKKKMGDTGAAQGQSVQVNVSLGEGINPDPNSVLIVSVHRADGSPMPVAAARYPLGTFPRTVVLDDGNSMLQDIKLSSLDELVVKARLDTDGNVATRDGDWHGESDVANLGDSVALIIDKRY
ncbi:c-type cytochrome biogenesis protein CcmI [Vibrio nigripulchritudo]|uniref:c-type cytochrome biogenesis protein CcmI n=1 Tax=Vibrio nigripulchritudo TaxID=28173 RepID=UPI0024920959|nr:c-type cytochrome biogenesis protein CcmI [Vibrio nigripulchritudo]BDU38045.1 c-type cytochrome biogenesis protein CcmI [Vibrio nigripulchritudo]BDU43767.1 c-type cytochrome biogenesis protein CcmI [Vibrio nigripulchritudo]